MHCAEEEVPEVVDCDQQTMQEGSDTAASHVPQVGAHGSEMWRDNWWEDAYAQSVATISGTIGVSSSRCPDLPWRILRAFRSSQHTIMC